MKNVILLSTARSGTTYLLDTIVHALPRCYDLNEFFNLHKEIICKHIDYIRIYLQQNKTECIAPYKDFLNAIQDLNEEKHIYEDLVDDTHLRMKLKQLKESNNWDYSFTKVFDTHYQEPEKLLEMTDYLIVLYRNNLLAQFISHEKAKQSGVWYLNNNTKTDKLLDKSRGKVEWNKKAFLDFVGQTTEAYAKFIDIYNNYKGNKIWMCYEDMISVDIKTLCSGLREDLDLPVDFKLYRKNNSQLKPIKQSVNVSTEDNFNNPEMFLADLLDIKDKMFAY